MTIFVDRLRFRKVNGVKKYAHMISNKSRDELDAFALKVGVKGHFFHFHPRHEHYDINERQYQLAIENGAIIVTPKGLVQIKRDEAVHSNPFIDDNVYSSQQLLEWHKDDIIAGIKVRNTGRCGSEVKQLIAAFDYRLKQTLQFERGK